jgi:hypothetical protein
MHPDASATFGPSTPIGQKRQLSSGWEVVGSRLLGGKKMFFYGIDELMG